MRVFKCDWCGEIVEIGQFYRLDVDVTTHYVSSGTETGDMVKVRVFDICEKCYKKL